MTGNTKVWRAPLAGLASLAMIATMGVAALTANAAEKTVTLDANGGYFSKASETTKKLTEDSSDAGYTPWFEDLYQTVPQRAGYKFTGWYTEKGTQAVSPKAEDLAGETLEAHWTTAAAPGKVSFIAGAAALNNTEYLKYDGTKDTTAANETDGSAYSVYVASGDTLASWQVPADKNDADADQYDWYVSPTGGAKADTTKLAAGSKVYLQKTVLSGYTVTFQTAGATAPGLFKDSFADNVKTTYRVEKGAKLTAPEGYYWLATAGAADGTVPVWTANTGDTLDKINDNGGVKANLTFTASAGTTPVHLVALKDFEGPANPAGSGTQKVLAVTDGATVNSVKRFAAPKDTDDYKFDAFYTDAAYLNKASLDSSVKQSFDLYAKWTKIAQDVKVTFDLNYDNAPKATVVTVKQNAKVAKPANPTRKGYVFKYWYESTDTSANPADVFADDTFKTDADVTLLAKWQSEADAELESVAIYRGENKKDSDGNRAYDVDSFDAYKAVYDKYFDATGKVVGEAGKLKTGADKAEAIKEVQKALNAVVENADAKLYRAYNPGNGDHYFTKDDSTQSWLVRLGWKAEGAPYKVANERAAIVDGHKVGLNLGTAVWSVYNPNTGEHLLVQEYEADALAKAGWNKEQIQFYTPQGAKTNVYRVYNPNTNGPAHIYVSKDEGTGLVKLGWRWDFGGKVAFKLS